MKPRNLPADLIRQWARRQTAASAKLEGRELPEDYVRSAEVQWFLDSRKPSEPDPLVDELIRQMRAATAVGHDARAYPGLLMIPNELKLP